MARKVNGQSGSRAAFPTTTWTLIRQANAEELTESERAAALGTLLRRYWKPMYSYVRSQGQSPHDAEEVVQDFITSIVDGNNVLAVDSAEGRFRDWLRTCLKNFLTSVERKRRAKKRRPAEGVKYFAALKAMDGEPYEPSHEDRPDDAMDDTWRRDLVDRALETVANEAKVEGRSLDYRVFMDYYCHDEFCQPSWQEIADRHGLSWKIAARRADWVKRHLGQAIRMELAHYVDAADIEDEIRQLLG